MHKRKHDQAFSEEKFLKGAVKFCHHDHFPDHPSSLSFAQVVGDRSQVERAIICTYGYDENWLAKQFSPSTEITIISQAKRFETWRKQGQVYRLSRGDKMRKLYIPKFRHCNGRKGCFHTKLICLFKKDGSCRIVIPTANAKRFDWTHIENVMVSLQA
jgi:hypothetical protein